MIEMLLMAVMLLSMVGMMLASANDPLSRRFWEDMRDGMD